MIPTQNIIAWSHVAPWPEQRQIEQDLIICRALIEIFSAENLCGELRFRGGTALNKLHFPAPLRYSEDIDLVRTTSGPIGPLLDGLRAVLEPWLGKPRFDQSPVAPKLRFQVASEDGGAASIRLKIEINTRETQAFDESAALPMSVNNPWFSGQADIPTYTREEILATKFRALLQRDKGRDLFDLTSALELFEGLDNQRLIAIFLKYLQLSGQLVSRAQAQERMFGKLANPRFLSDLRPLLPPGQAWKLTGQWKLEAFRRVFTQLVDLLPGKPWGRTPAMQQRFNISW